MGRIPFAVLLIGMALMLVSCGTVDVDVHTEVKSPTQFVQSLIIRADGALSTMIATAFDSERMRADGWHTTIKTEGNRATLTATRTLDRGTPSQGLLPASSPTGPVATPLPSFSLDVRENIFDREYRVRMVFPANPTSQPWIGANPQVQQLSQQVAQQMLRVRWKITLPGQVIESNADNREGNGGTWNLDLLTLQKGREMIIASRESNPVNIAAAATGSVAAIGLVILRVARPHRRPRPSATDSG